MICSMPSQVLMRPDAVLAALKLGNPLSDQDLAPIVVCLPAIPKPEVRNKTIINRATCVERMPGAE